MERSWFIMKIPTTAISDWCKLTPDINGSYVNGTWSQLASLQSNYGPLFFASAVLAGWPRDHRRRRTEFRQYVWTNMGAIYDPDSQHLDTVTPPSGWSSIGDASGIVLSNGTFMLANCCTARRRCSNGRP